MGHPKADPVGLALRHLPSGGADRLLVVGPPDGMAAERLDPGRSERFGWFTTDARVHRALVAEGYRSRWGPWLPSGGGFDAALVFLPPGRERIRMTLAMVAASLPAGAPLTVVGTRREGIESTGRELAAVADPSGTESGKHARLLRGRVRGGGEEGSATLDSFEERWTLNVERWGERPPLEVTSFPGVFSHGRLDDGTRLLLETVPDLPGPLLDVGSGAGIIGTCYGARGAGEVTLVDADALAVEASRRTLARNRVSGSVHPGDVFPIGDLSVEGDTTADRPREGGWRSIVSNPPFHRGVATDERVTGLLLAGARERLLPGGTLTLVCNRFLPVQDRLDRAFGGHRILADDGRYRVYQATVG